MQKLEKRNIYTPIGAPQAGGNCGSVVRHDCEVGRVLQNLKTFSNSSDVDTPSKEAKRNLRVSVYVLNMRRHPLMSTTPTKARILLKEKRATVVCRFPFTIQLNYATGESKQPITLGINAGYSVIGFSANSQTQELISGTVELRKNVSKKIAERRKYRKNRRSRLWYGKPRFLNRKKEKGWLAPSIKHKLDTHIQLIEKIKKILPITKVIIEIAKFDTQKMQNPEIKGVEYQQGTLYGTEIKAYLLEKYRYKCVYCHKSNIPLEVEHTIPKSRGRSNRISNLTISCRACNLKKGNKTADEFGFSNIQKQAKKTLKATAFMNNVTKKLVDILKANSTYGDITKYMRTKLELEKSHINDAFVIAQGTNQERCNPYIVKQIRRNNHSIQTNRKGYKRSIRRQRYKLQPFDLVKHNNKFYRVKGMFNYGTWVRLIDFEMNVRNVTMKKIEFVQYGKGLQFI